MFVVAGCSNNYLGEEGAGLLGDALKENVSLTELHLKGNALGDAGVGFICQALAQRQCRIKSLDLGNNEYASNCTLLVRPSACQALLQYKALTGTKIKCPCSGLPSFVQSWSDVG
jgi:Ran GTPase-activating protein (RanGAP) involved in mRNA processing and transport